MCRLFSTPQTPDSIITRASLKGASALGCCVAAIAVNQIGNIPI